MNETTPNWNGWESQLNRKTERRRKADAIRLQRFRKAALIVLNLAALPGAAALLFCACGLLSITWAVALTAVSIVLMSFTAGYTCGIIKYK